jgi:hypothetical protein
LAGREDALASGGGLYALYFRAERLWRQLNVAVFGIFYVMLKEGHGSNLAVLLAFFIDFLQLASFFTEPRYWGDSHVAKAAYSLASFFTSEFWIKRASPENALWLARVCYAAVFVSVANAVYVGYCYQRNEFVFLWPVRMLRTIISTFATVLAIPLMGFLFIVHCPAESLDKLCLNIHTAVTPVDTVLATLALCLFLPMVALARALFFDPDPRTDYVAAKAHARLELASLLREVVYVATLITVPSNTSSRHNGYLVAIYIVSSVLFLVLHCLSLPFYKLRINRFVGGLHGMLVVQSLFAGLIVAVGKNSLAASETLACLMLIALAPAYWFGSRFCVWTAQYFYAPPSLRLALAQTDAIRAALARLRLPPVNISALEQAYKSLTGARGAAASASVASFASAGADDEAVATCAVVEEEKAVVAADEENAQACAAPQAVVVNGNESAALDAAQAVQDIAALRSHEEDDDNSHMPVAWFPSPAHVELCTRFLQHDASEANVHLAEAIFASGMREHPRSALVAVHYALFLMNYARRDDDAAEILSRIEQGSLYDDVPVDVSFFVFRHEQTRKRAASGSAVTGGEGEHMNLINYIELQKNLSRSKQEYDSAVEKLGQFWAMLLHHEVDLDELDRVMKDIMQAQRRAAFSFSSLLERYPNSAMILRAYGRFLLAVKNQPDAAKQIFDKADLLEEQQSRHRPLDHVRRSSAVSLGSHRSVRSASRTPSPAPSPTGSASPLSRQRSLSVGNRPRLADEAGGQHRHSGSGSRAGGSQPPTPRSASPCASEESRTRKVRLLLRTPSSPSAKSSASEGLFPAGAASSSRPPSPRQAVSFDANAVLAAPPRISAPVPESPSAAADGGGADARERASSDGSRGLSAQQQNIRQRWNAALAKMQSADASGSSSVRRLRLSINLLLAATVGFVLMTYMYTSLVLGYYRDNAERNIEGSDMATRLLRMYRSVRELDLCYRYSNVSNNPPAFAGTGTPADRMYPPHWFLPWPGGYEKYNASFEQQLRRSIREDGRITRQAFASLVLSDGILRPPTRERLERRSYTVRVPVESTGALVPTSLNYASLGVSVLRHFVALADVNFTAWAASQSTASVMPQTRHRSLDGQESFWYLLWNEITLPTMSWLDLLKEDHVALNRILIMSAAMSFFFSIVMIVYVSWCTLRPTVTFITAEKQLTLTAFLQIPRSIIHNLADFYRREREGDTLEDAGETLVTAGGDGCAGNGTAGEPGTSGARSIAAKNAAARSKKRNNRRRVILHKSQSVLRLQWRYVAALASVLVLQLVIYTSITSAAEELGTLRALLHLASSRALYVNVVEYFQVLISSHSGYTPFNTPSMDYVMHPAFSAMPYGPYLEELSMLHGNLTFGGRQLQGTPPMLHLDSDVDALLFGDVCAHAGADCSGMDAQTRALAAQGVHAAFQQYFSVGRVFLMGYNPQLGFNDPSVRESERLHGAHGLVVQSARVAIHALYDKIEALLTRQIGISIGIFACTLALVVAEYVLVFQPMISLLEEEDRHSKLMFLMIPFEALVAMPSVLKCIGVSLQELGVDECRPVDGATDASGGRTAGPGSRRGSFSGLSESTQVFARWPKLTLLLCTALGLIVWAIVAFEARPRGVDVAALWTRWSAISAVSVFDGLLAGITPLGLGFFAQFAGYRDLGLSMREVSAWIALAQVAALAPLALWMLLARRRVEALVLKASVVGAVTGVLTCELVLKAPVLEKFFEPGHLLVLRSGAILGMALGAFCNVLVRKDEDVGLPDCSRVSGQRSSVWGELISLSFICGLLESTSGSGAGIVLYAFCGIYYSLRDSVNVATQLVVQWAVSLCLVLSRAYLAGETLPLVSTELAMATIPISMMAVGAGAFAFFYIAPRVAQSWALKPYHFATLLAPFVAFLVALATYAVPGDITVVLFLAFGAFGTLAIISCMGVLGGVMRLKGALIYEAQEAELTRNITTNDAESCARSCAGGGVSSASSSALQAASAQV